MDAIRLRLLAELGRHWPSLQPAPPQPPPRLAQPRTDWVRRQTLSSPELTGDPPGSHTHSARGSHICLDTGSPEQGDEGTGSEQPPAPSCWAGGGQQGPAVWWTQPLCTEADRVRARARAARVRLLFAALCRRTRSHGGLALYLSQLGVPVRHTQRCEQGQGPWAIREAGQGSTQRRREGQEGHAQPQPEVSGS